MSLPITLTPEALQFYARCLTTQKRQGVRFSVKEDKGCAPLRYLVDLVNAPQPGDLADCLDGVTVWVDLKSAQHLHGLTVEVKTQGLNQKVIFNNPRAQTTCGCGETFSIASEEDAQTSELP